MTKAIKYAPNSDAVCIIGKKRYWLTASLPHGNAS